TEYQRRRPPAALPARCLRVEPRRAVLHHPGDLAEGLLGDGQRLGQHGDLPQIRRHETYVPLLVDGILGHVAMRFLDAAFGEVAGVAVVLVPGPAGQAAGMNTRTAHGRDDKIAYLEALDG